MLTGMVDWMPGTGNAMTELAQQQGQDQQGQGQGVNIAGIDPQLANDIKGGTGFDPQQYAQHMTNMYAPQSNFSQIANPQGQGGGSPQGAFGGSNTSTMEQMYNMSNMSPDASKAIGSYSAGKSSDIPNLMGHLYNEPGANPEILDRIREQQDREDAIPEGGYDDQSGRPRSPGSGGKTGGSSTTRGGIKPPSNRPIKPVLPPDQAPLFDENGNFILPEERARRYQEYQNRLNPTSPWF